ncbi:MAG: hypothetical protein ACLGSA_12440 [Acidobacteriota bacterium]
MPSEIREKRLDAVDAQASSAPSSAPGYATGAPTTLSKGAGGNMQGAGDIEVWLEVSAAPSGVTYAELHMEISPDGGTTWSQPVNCGFGKVPITDTKPIFLGRVKNAPETFRLKWYARSYVLTGLLKARGILYEAQ